MGVTPDELGFDFFPRVGYASAAERASVWPGFALAASCLGELLAVAGSRGASLEWSDEDAGWIASGRGPLGDVIGWLDFGGGSLWLERREPQEGSWMELEGRACVDVASWVRSTSARLAGLEPALEGDASPGGLIRGADAVLALGEADVRGDIEALYESAGLVLTAVTRALSGEGMPRIDLSTFEASVEVPLTGGGGAAVGLRPPPAGGGGSAAWFVRGEEGGGCVELAVESYVGLGDGDAQGGRVAEFVCGALCG